ncbi:MAG: hypothetical protein SOX56_07265 [[Pasteurella] mairii]|uniref:Uncharacterized protein n=1 Tax=[Pasteurella] mairii TaxID=757 RepID=A0A379B485_9PAST|nr:hypothetical protein [[Pasteurella] mairii]SUB33316.1 Uncharacterised protein [[Pasteurella] mairii]
MVEKREKNKGGRPQKNLNEEQLAQVEALAAFLTMEQIADYFCIAKSTFQAICERQPEVFSRYKKGRTNAVGTIAKSLIQQAREGNLSAQIFYLKTQGGWRETNNLDLTSSDGTMTPKTIIRKVVDSKND